MRIYAVSRASVPDRVAMWKYLRDVKGVNIISTWIDEAGSGETQDLSELWRRIADEIASCDRVVMYVEPQDFPLKGALIEIGIAIAAKKPIVLVAPGCEFAPPSYRPIGSWIRHPLVKRTGMVESACLFDGEPF
jgi:hypothetical protein